MKKHNVFWIGYSDLMTSLFFIMLVIAVITIGSLEKDKKAKEEQLNKIEELQTAIKQLPEDYFEYQPQYKRFKIKKQIQFAKGSSVISPEYNDYLINVGQSISDLIIRLNENPGYKKFDIKYLIVIEGMASKDNYKGNYKLSYLRALELFKLWDSTGIRFNQKICELQIAGSGTKGIREYSGAEEYKNQQFLIHIIPKIGKIADE